MDKKIAFVDYTTLSKGKETLKNSGYRIASLKEVIRHIISTEPFDDLDDLEGFVKEGVIYYPYPKRKYFLVRNSPILKDNLREVEKSFKRYGLYYCKDNHLEEALKNSIDIPNNLVKTVDDESFLEIPIDEIDKNRIIIFVLGNNLAKEYCNFMKKNEIEEVKIHLPNVYTTTGEVVDEPIAEQVFLYPDGFGAAPLLDTIEMIWGSKSK